MQFLMRELSEKCSREEHIPIIRKPTTFQLKEAERKQTVYEKLSRAAGIQHAEEKSSDTEKQDTTLREIVDRNYEKRISKDAVSRPEMINNFHWIIMRARRMKKLTQEQLAKEISESEAAIKMAEKGILPEDDYRLVNKLESYLGIKIIRPEFARDIREKTQPELKFGRDEAKRLTIGDIKKMEQKEPEEIPEEADEIEEIEFGDEIGEVESNEDKGEVSQEEMDRILFGKKLLYLL